MLNKKINTINELIAHPDKTKYDDLFEIDKYKYLKKFLSDIHTNRYETLSLDEVLERIQWHFENYAKQCNKDECNGCNECEKDIRDLLPENQRNNYDLIIKDLIDAKFGSIKIDW